MLNVPDTDNRSGQTTCAYITCSLPSSNCRSFALVVCSLSSANSSILSYHTAAAVNSRDYTETTAVDCRNVQTDRHTHLMCFLCLCIIYMVVSKAKQY